MFLPFSLPSVPFQFSLYFGLLLLRSFIVPSSSYYVEAVQENKVTEKRFYDFEEGRTVIEFMPCLGAWIRNCFIEKAWMGMIAGKGLKTGLRFTKVENVKLLCSWLYKEVTTRRELKRLRCGEEYPGKKSECVECEEWKQDQVYSMCRTGKLIVACREWQQRYGNLKDWDGFFFLSCHGERRVIHGWHVELRKYRLNIEQSRANKNWPDVYDSREEIGGRHSNFDTFS